MILSVISAAEATDLVIKHHYLHRRPPISFAFGLIANGVICGAITFGVPASRHMQISACPSAPEKVLELNRLWCADELPANTESWFVCSALKKLPPRVIVSYADTAVGHIGYIYRACNFNYAGWTDMERKTPRFDYVTPGKHSRAAFRADTPIFVDRVRRKPKIKYWVVTGNRAEKRELEKRVNWPKLDWKTIPPPRADVLRP